MTDTNVVNYNEYRERYNSNCQLWRSEPVNDRKLNNPICLAILIALTVCFLAVGGYYIATRSDYEQPTPDYNTSTFSFGQYKAPILVCTFSSVVVSLVYIFLIKLFPRGMVLTLIFVSLGLLAVLCIIGLAIGNYGLAISMAIVLLVYAIVLACFKNRIKTGIVLVKVATNFMSAKPIVFLTPLIKVVLTVVFAVFWVYTFSLIIEKANYLSQLHQDYSTENFFTGIWVILWLFYTFFFYYLMVFTVAVTCAFWYYNVEGKNPIVTAYKWIIKSALGAITFAAILITLVTFARMVIDNKRKNNKNIAVAVCLCIMSCLLKQIERLLQILNHNTIICMAVTGEDFIDSAKTAIGIVCSDLPLFSVTRIITNLLVFWGTIISVGIPCIFAFLWVGLNKDTENDAALVIVIVGFASIMISGMIYSVLVESVSSVFIFYLFDRRFKELGYQSHNMPAEINHELGNAHS